MAYNRGERPDSPMKRRGGRRRKKVCVFCGKERKYVHFVQMPTRLWIIKMLLY